MLLAQEAAEVTLGWPHYAAGVAALLGIATGLWRGWRKLRRRTLDPLAKLAAESDCLGQMARDWRGEQARPGFRGRPGVPERLAHIEDSMVAMDRRMARVEVELTPNGGTSVKDRVDAIAHATGADERT